jgi:hypothetical protein
MEIDADVARHDRMTTLAELDRADQRLIGR